MKFHLILDPLLRNQNIFQKLKEKYPEIIDDLDSAKDNTQCSCRGRVAAFLYKKYNEEPEEKSFIDDLINSDILVLKGIEAILGEHQRINDILGKVHVLEKKDNYYQDFLNYLENNMIHHFVRSFSVVDKGDKVEIYLLGWKQ